MDGATETEKSKMLRSELYTAFVPELIAERARCAQACDAFNTATGASRTQMVNLFNEILQVPPLPRTADLQAAPWVEPPFKCDYGYNIILGKSIFINFNCVILDTCKVEIGSRTLFGPSVSLFTATHPNSAALRDGLRGPELGRPITIGEDCWLGGNVVVLPGVSIGSGCVVGAGAVVTKDIPPNCVAAGNPARVIKRLKVGAPEGGEGEGESVVKVELTEEHNVRKLHERLEKLEVEMKSIQEEMKGIQEELKEHL